MVKHIFKNKHSYNIFRFAILVSNHHFLIKHIMSWTKQKPLLLLLLSLSHFKAFRLPVSSWYTRSQKCPRSPNVCKWPSAVLIMTVCVPGSEVIMNVFVYFFFSYFSNILKVNPTLKVLMFSENGFWSLIIKTGCLSPIQRFLLQQKHFPKRLKKKWLGNLYKKKLHKTFKKHFSLL